MRGTKMCVCTFELVHLDRVASVRMCVNHSNRPLSSGTWCMCVCLNANGSQLSLQFGDLASELYK